jgi:hypothetical protein
MNLVLGTALNYDIEHVKCFVLSLRKHYDGNVVLLVSNISQDFEDYLDLYEIETYKIPNSKNQDEICSMRHRYYREIIENRDVDKVLLTDVRDVVFQSDPFAHEMITDLEFFLEPGLYKDCDCHRHWFCSLEIHGCEFYQSIGDRTIVCAGTTIGKKDAILFYLNKMIEELSKMNRIITDQPTHAYMIYNNFFTNFRLYETLKGPIATLSSSRDLKFDSENNLLNEDDSVVAVVHQWDRTEYKDIFYNKAIE